MKRILFPIVFVSFFCFFPLSAPTRAVVPERKSHPETDAVRSANPDILVSYSFWRVQTPADSLVDPPERLKIDRLAVGIVVLFTLILLLSMLYYYIRIRKAIRAAIRAIGAFGSGRVKIGKAGAGQPPTKRDIELTLRLHEMLCCREAYRDSDQTLESMARSLGVSRESLSRAVNRTTGKNFSRFLNEYRIKEAIRRLSVSRNGTVNFDDLSEQVGFNNRTSFHRAFKQITGHPPTVFRNNQ